MSTAVIAARYFGLGHALQIEETRFGIILRLGVSRTSSVLALNVSPRTPPRVRALDPGRLARTLARAPLVCDLGNV